jgi:hypothetical protein
LSGKAGNGSAMYPLSKLEKFVCWCSAMFFAGITNPNISLLQYLGTAFGVYIGLSFTIWWVKNFTGGDG